MEEIKNKYHQGKIYSIRSYQTNKIYIGSTCQPLHKRLYEHKIKYNQFQNGKYHNVTSFEILKYNDYYIELLEVYKCENKNELTKREGELIRQNINICVNRCIAGRTNKEYREDNIGKINKYGKLYYKNNKEEVNKKNKQYYETNKEKIYEKKNQKIICGCGNTYTCANKSRHEKSKKHIDFINKEIEV